MVYRNIKTGIEIDTPCTIAGENYVLVTEEPKAPAVTPGEVKEPEKAPKVSEEPKKEVKKSKKGSKK